MIASPIAGWVTTLDEVPDPVFAQRMLGDGVAIDPTEGRVVAPGAGFIVTLNPSGHAVTIDLDNGVQLLIHVGIDTVALGGTAFTAHVAQGARVAAGDTLITFDMDYLARNAKSLITPILITRGGRVAAQTDRLVACGGDLLHVAAEQANASDTLAVASAVRRLRLPLKHGLHARPAARIADLARGYDAQLELHAEGGRRASALSPVAMLALTLSHGAELTIEGSGPQAEDAVIAVAALIESGMGEAAPIPAAVPAPPAPAEEVPPPQHAPVGLLHGVTGAPGFAMAPSYRLDVAPVSVAPAASRGAAAEKAALDVARAEVRTHLTTRAAVGGPAGEVASAHLAFVDDPSLLLDAHRSIDQGGSAGQGWMAATQGFMTALQGGGDRFAERIDDLRDLERQILAALRGESLEQDVPRGAILVAREILPSQLMGLVDAGVAGICTAEGGPTSHAAIIAASMGIPMLTALGPSIEAIANGTILILDATNATVAVDPTTAEQAAASINQAQRDEQRKLAEVRQYEPAVTIDGKHIEIFANLGSLSDAQAAVRVGAEGCGLLRTEFLFLDRPSAPDEDEQLATYQGIADALQGRPLIVRTLDIGADKPAAYVPLPHEENPALGVRGLRLGLARPDLLATQLRALIRVESHDIKIMLPMVSSLYEVQEVQAILARETAALRRAAPMLGIMVETPAAALIADTLAAEVAFLSIGSNDLSQYTLAMDRGNSGTAAGLDALHPAVLRLIRATVDGANRHNRWTGVCGGMAADPQAIAILVGLGVTELSVPTAAVAETKQIVRRIDMQAAMRLATQACDAPDTAAVRQLVRRFMEGVA